MNFDWCSSEHSRWVGGCGILKCSPNTRKNWFAKHKLLCNRREFSGGTTKVYKKVDGSLLLVGVSDQHHVFWIRFLRDFWRGDLLCWTCTTYVRALIDFQETNWWANNIPKSRGWRTENVKLFFFCSHRPLFAFNSTLSFSLRPKQIIMTRIAGTGHGLV